MELKFMQNSFGMTILNGKIMKVQTTMTRVDIYDNDVLVGSASVKKS